MQTTRLGVVQCPVSQDTEKNKETICSFLQKASENNVELVVFPEKSLQWDNVSCPDLSQHLSDIGDVCGMGKVAAVIGAVELKNDKKVNQAYLLEKNGSIATVHQKINLWHEEKALYAPGLSSTMANITVGRVGIAICWDNARPDLIRQMGLAGVDIVCAPCHFNEYGPMSRFLDGLPIVRAFENMCIYLLADQPETRGISGIYHPHGTLAEIDQGEVGLIWADVNLSALQKLKQHYGLP